MNSVFFRQRFIFSALRWGSLLVLGLASFGSVLAQEGYSLHRALYDSQVTEVNSYHTPECEEFFAAGYGARDPKLEKKCLLLPRALPATGADAADSTKTVEVEIAGTIQRLTDQVTTFVGTIAVLMIVIYGFRISVSFNDSETIEKSKKGIIWCLTGLIVITFAYVIVKTVVSIAFLGQDTEIWLEMNWESGTVMGTPSSDRQDIQALITLNQDSNQSAATLSPASLSIDIAAANNNPLQCRVLGGDFCISNSPSQTANADLGRFIMANAVQQNNENFVTITSNKAEVKQCSNININEQILASEVKVECKQEVNNTTAEGALYFRVNKHSFCSQLPAARSKGSWKFQENTEDKTTIDAVFGKLKGEYKKITKIISISEKAQKLQGKVKEVEDDTNTEDPLDVNVAKIQAVLKYHEYYDGPSFTEHIKKFSPELTVTDGCKEVDGKYGSCTKAALESWCIDPNPFAPELVIVAP